MNQADRKKYIVTYANEKYKERACEVARSFSLECNAPDSKIFINYQILINLDSNGWSLKFDPSLKIGNELRINFQEYLKKNKDVKSSLLVKALTTKTLNKPLVFDATAGLAKDSLLLAFSGLEVFAVEKNKILAFLIAEAQKDFNLSLLPWQKQFAEALRFEHLDARDLLSDPKKLTALMGKLPDCIYLDPMFPPKKKTAKVKKEMQILQFLCDDNSDAELLLTSALQLGVKQVVVKRMKNSEYLGNLEPTRQVLGDSNRFDIYANN
jgi:16S rRNA (guanine1516-N2)-methyltransferase